MKGLIYSFLQIYRIGFWEKNQRQFSCMILQVKKLWLWNRQIFTIIHLGKFKTKLNVVFFLNKMAYILFY